MSQAEQFVLVFLLTLNGAKVLRAEGGSGHTEQLPTAEEKASWILTLIGKNAAKATLAPMVLGAAA